MDNWKLKKQKQTKMTKTTIIEILKIPENGRLIGGTHTEIHQTDHLINLDHQINQLLTKHPPHLIQIGENMEGQIIT